VQWLGRHQWPGLCRNFNTTHFVTAIKQSHALWHRPISPKGGVYFTILTHNTVTAATFTSIYDLQLFKAAEFGSTSTERPSSRFRGYQNYLIMWYPATAQNVTQQPFPKRSSSNAYNVKDADTALESFNPVQKAQKAESSFSAIVRTRSDVLPSISQRQLQRKRSLEVDVGLTLPRDKHKKKNRRINLTGLPRVLGNRSYEDNRVLLNSGGKTKNDDFQKHSSVSLIENKVKLLSPRVLLDSIRTDIPASKVAQVESQNGDTYTTSHISNAAKAAQAVAERVSSQVVTQKDITSTPEATQTYLPINPADQNPPCNTLYVGNLPIDTAEGELKCLFSRQPGYKKLAFRIKQNGPICFIEFEDVAFATKALSELYGHPVLLSIFNIRKRPY